jgi:hypothetical protein
MALLAMIQKAAKKLNLNSPSAVIGNTNKETIQLLNIADEEGQDLAQRYRWQRLVEESTFTSVATESQGSMTTLAGTDYGWLCNDTVWNRTRNRRMFPVDDVQWQGLKSNTITGPDEYFRIRGNTFIVIPTMTAGHTVAFEWVSKNWCETSGGTGQSAWAADTDVGVLDENLMGMGIIWRFKKYKGLDYAEDFNLYEAQVANAIARDGAKKRLSTGSAITTRFLDRKSVSEGSWS